LIPGLAIQYRNRHSTTRTLPSTISSGIDEYRNLAQRFTPQTASMAGVQPPASSTLPVFPENDHRIPIHPSHYVPRFLIPTIVQNRIFCKLIKEDKPAIASTPLRLDSLLRASRVSTGQSLANPPKETNAGRMTLGHILDCLSIPTSRSQLGALVTHVSCGPFKPLPRGRPHSYANFFRKLSKG